MPYPLRWSNMAMIQWKIHHLYLDGAPSKTSIYQWFPMFLSLSLSHSPIATLDFLRVSIKRGDVSIKTDGLTWQNHRQPGVDHQTNLAELHENRKKLYSVCVNMYIYIYISIYLSIYLSLSLSMYVYVYMYISKQADGPQNTGRKRI